MRKTLKWTVPGSRSDKIGERDCGKTFLLTETPADQAERWALRVFLAVARVGVELPANIQQLGMAGVAALGFQALGGLKWEDAEPLFDELMGCVQYVSDAGLTMPLLSGANSQIEDVATRVMLKRKVFELHTGFSLPVAIPT